MYTDKKILIARSDKDLFLYPSMANRHGMIAGATGTGKTVTMKVLAESFSDMGVPVFMADVKGDISGMSRPGVMSESMAKRISSFGLENFTFHACPTRYWDVFGEKGIPIRVTISDMGPVLLSRLLGLTEIQAGVLNIVFMAADDKGLLLLDLKDLRAMLKYVGENREEYTLQYGNVSAASIGAIQRALLKFETEGGSCLFGEPALNMTDMMRTDVDGKGYINVLNSQRLIQSPTTYAIFLMWMLAELLEKLPEVGDPEKPRMVFFFDEAHLLFEDASKAFLQKITQVVRLIRSKGVGVYFVTQSPSDIPTDVLGQLSNRIQHALRAYTPAEQTAIRAAAKAYRVNPSFKTEEALTELGVGEALISMLDENGTPCIVERARILPPQSQMGPITDSELLTAVQCDEFFLKYGETVDRESAYEILEAATALLQQQMEEEAARQEAEKQAEKEALEQKKAEEKAAREEQKALEAQQKAAEREALAEQRAAEKAAEKAALAEQRAVEKAALAEQKAAAKKKNAVKTTAQRAATNAASSVARSVSTNMVNSVLGGKKASTGTIAKRAANTALSSVLRSGVTSIVRGIFGNKK